MKIVALSALLLSPLALMADEPQDVVLRKDTVPAMKTTETATRLDEVVRRDDNFYENRVNVAYETAALFDIANTNNYTFLPQAMAIHWQLDDVGNEGWRRGNTEFIFSGFYAPVLDGPEDYFAGALFGPRYNFVQEGWKFIPYIESRVGVGFTNSGNVLGAQGQDFMFTFTVGTGVRYLINDRWDVSVGAMYQHFSNGGLSEPARKNSGLDSIGPVVGLSCKL